MDIFVKFSDATYKLIRHGGELYWMRWLPYSTPIINSPISHYEFTKRDYVEKIIDPPFIYQVYPYQDGDF